MPTRRLIKIITTICSLCILTSSYGVTHQKLLVLSAELGHSLDKFYYDAGTKIDIVIFDLKELQKQGKSYPDKLLTTAMAADRQLRSKWLSLDLKRVKIWQEKTRLLDATAKKIDQLQKAVNAYGKWAATLATKINNETAPVRKGLIYKFADFPKNWWSKNFIRSIDLSYKIYGIDKYKYPGNYMNIEYVAKAFHDLQLNLISVEASTQYQQQLLESLNQYSGTPFMLWGSDKSFDDKDCISYKYYGNRAKLKKDIFKYVEYFNYRFFAGIQLDEPVIEDNHKRYGKLLKVKGIKDAYAKYINTRKTLLEQNGIKFSTKPFTVKPKNANQQALYIEWQLFKKQYMADHYKWLFEMMQNYGLFTSTVVMNRNRTTPQMCSFVSMGRDLPYLGTDIYQNGTAIESLAMQLLKNSAAKRAIFWPGASYSCKTPETFKRTMATGLTHADGIHMWTYLYCSKYRDANYFWRNGGQQPNMDDRKRLALQNWYPWAWQVMKDMYALATAADKYLGDRKSIAQTAILISEQTLITNYLTRGLVRKYWENNLAIYCALLKAGIPVDVCFIESMSAAKLKQYKVIIASDMRATTQQDNSILKSWVKQGGTLISTGEISLYDEWGRKRRNYALTKLLGVNFKGITQGRLTLKYAGNEAYYPGFENYIIAQKHQNAQAINFFESKRPGLVLNNYGAGVSYYFTIMNFGTRSRTSYNGNGLMNPIFPGFDKILYNIIKIKTSLPISVTDLPSAVEVQIQQSSNDRYIVNLLDWHDKRQITGHSLHITLPGKWRIIYPGVTRIDEIESGKQYKLRKFRIYDMIVIEKINQITK